jgi:DNA uptake protein ComE-like DNA-binding protein
MKMSTHCYRILTGSAALAVVLGTGLAVTGCARQDNAKIQRDAAQATEQAKQDTREAAANTRQALGEAENAVNAAADGVKQGIKAHTGPDGSSSTGTTADGKIDINSASHAQLTALPGITDAKADAIIAGRPYAMAHSLVSKGILTSAQYRRIESEVAAE